MKTAIIILIALAGLVLGIQQVGSVEKKMENKMDSRHERWHDARGQPYGCICRRLFLVHRI
jgi:hypothetical protein